MILLSILFLVTAILYSSVGFGGGSTYLALLLIWGIPYYVFPVIALACNIIVVSGNCFNFIKAGNLNVKLLTPYLIGSVPLAYIGGSLSIEKHFFEVLVASVEDRVGRRAFLMMGILMGVAALLAALVDEVTSILVMVTSLFHLLRRYKVNPIPFFLMIVLMQKLVVHQFLLFLFQHVLLFYLLIFLQLIL